MKTPDHEQLIELLLADELSPDQQEQLRDLVANDAAIENEVFEQMWLEPLLRDSFCSNPDDFVERIEAAFDSSDDTTQFTEKLLDAWTERSAKRSRRKWLGALVGTVLAVFLMVLFFPPQNDPVEASNNVQLQNAFGNVEIVSRDGSSRTASAGDSIEPGDTLNTTGESSATIVWEDGSRVTLTRDASITWPADKTLNILLNAGLAHVDRKSDSESPLVVATQHATVEAPMSKFVLATSKIQTDVTVTHGQARLTSATGQPVDLSNGECCVAKSKSIEVRKGTATPDEWTEDFENGLPDGWQGKFISENLPPGSRGAVQTRLSRFEGGEPCHQVWSYSDWQHGLAVVHEDTCLNFTYWFKTSDRVQVLTLLRPPAPDSPAHEVQMLQPSDVPQDEQWWKIPSGKWYTVSIPLSRLRNPVSREHPTESYIATAFNFRPQDHACGLVIDRMWLTRGTSKKIEFKPLDEVN